MKKVLFILVIALLLSCRKDIHEHIPTYPLSGTTWELYQYKDPTTAMPLLRSDTLKFYDDNKYTYNDTINAYSLVENPISYSLILKGTVFGDISGTLPSNFISTGEILANEFKVLYLNKTYYIWLKKI